MKICPKCDQQMMRHNDYGVQGWFCSACDEFVEDEEYDEDDGDGWRTEAEELEEKYGTVIRGITTPHRRE